MDGDKEKGRAGRLALSFACFSARAVHMLNWIAGTC